MRIYKVKVQIWKKYQELKIKLEQIKINFLEIFEFLGSKVNMG